VAGPFAVSHLLMRRWPSLLFCTFSFILCAGLLVTGAVLQPTLHNWVKGLPKLGSALLLTIAVRLRLHYCRRILSSGPSHASESVSNHGIEMQSVEQSCDSSFAVNISDSAMGSNIRDNSVSSGARYYAQCHTSTMSSREDHRCFHNGDMTVNQSGDFRCSMLQTKSLRRQSSYKT